MTDLVREATDRQVVDVLLDHGPLTRARIAEAAGVSKPTASESVHRLRTAGVVDVGGRAEGGRGRVGTLCRIAPGAGLAAAIVAASGELVGEVVDATGATRHRLAHPLPETMAAARLVTALGDMVDRLEEDAGRPLPVRVVSVAAPVDRVERRLVQVGDSPFVVGEADLGPVLGADGVVDNDIAWAALAEAAVTDGLDPFVYLYLGSGLGGAVVDGGRLVAGRSGLAGEIAHVLTRGADGRAVTLLTALTDLGLARPGSISLDVAAVRARLADDPTPVVAALGGVLASVVALLEPRTVVVGGPWGRTPGLLDGLAEGGHGGAALLRPAALEDGAPLAGVRARAAAAARAALVPRQGSAAFR